jgi:hypothetical protein
VEDLILAAATYKELLDDSLVGKLFNFTSKNRLKKGSNKELCKHREFCNIPR